MIVNTVSDVRRMLHGMSHAQIQDIARKFLTAMRYMVDHNGLEDELDDTRDVIAPESTITAEASHLAELFNQSAVMVVEDTAHVAFVEQTTKAA